MAVLTLPGSGALATTVRAKALVFEDPLSRALLARIQQIAPSDATALVVGETGTGKEIVARHVHAESPRRDRVFVGVNCSAFPETLVESELFGHERGAFTGAHVAKPGWFETANGGTLFLDEIGDLPHLVQVKLLRVLQEREIVRLGARTPTPIDVRLIAATNVDLEDAVRAGRFREDLYYRIKVAELVIPPLRDRPGDILPLANHFLNVYGKRLGGESVELTPAAIHRMREHPWPGNIRELENVIHHALLVCNHGQITPNDLRLAVAVRRDEGLPPQAPVGVAALRTALHSLFESETPNLHALIDQTLVCAAYEYCDRNQLQTARLLGVSRNIVRARLIQYGELPVGARGASSALVAEGHPSTAS